ncbi:hypothetical protein [Flavobacterium denitrificans]|nr:hypothetical protein [Flavobacterium denitrificans]
MSKQIFEILLKAEKEASFNKGVFVGFIIAFAIAFTGWLLFFK